MFAILPSHAVKCCAKKKKNISGLRNVTLQDDEITSDRHALQSDNVKGRESGKRRCRQECTHNVKMGLKTAHVRVGMD
jgi:hypothetical protein